MIMLGSLGVIETIVGIIIMYNGMKLQFSGPPPYATATPSIEPQKGFLKEMMIMVITTLFLAAIMYGINVGLISIVF